MAPEVGRRACAAALILSLAATGCYVQQPLPRQPEYRPASWEPILGLTTDEGDEIEFDEPARIEADYVVGAVDGADYAVPLSDVDRLMVGRKQLDKSKTVLAAVLAGVAIVLFWRSIGFESSSASSPG
jgi:hypothetical protein